MEVVPFTMRQMVEAGMHFGHTTRRCNPKMLPWIFGQRNGVHIIDLEQSARLLREALGAVRSVVAAGGRVLIVGTKSQAQNIVAETAQACGQYYINRRWLGGTLTNWQTISKSIDSLKTLDEQLEKDDALEGLTKKEKLSLTRRRDKIERALGGIRDMNTLPDLMFVIDTNKEATAVKEAHNLSIPIAAVLDSNSNPDGIAYPIPGNDDAARSLAFYLSLLSQAVLSGREVVLAKQELKPEQEAALTSDKGASAQKEPHKNAREKGKGKDVHAHAKRTADKRDGNKKTHPDNAPNDEAKKVITVVKKKAKRTRADENTEVQKNDANDAKKDKDKAKDKDKDEAKDD